MENRVYTVILLPIIFLPYFCVAPLGAITSSGAPVYSRSDSQPAVGASERNMRPIHYRRVANYTAVRTAGISLNE